MTVLSAQTIRRRCIAGQAEHSPITDHNLRPWRLRIEPFEPFSKKAHGMSYGVTAAGYDIRLGVLNKDHPDRTTIPLYPDDLILCASLERVWIPHDLQVIVHDKSTLARQGLALQNTVLEPGWFGHITLEISNHSKQTFWLETGMPIAQLVFHRLDEPTTEPYSGKYQDQEANPVYAKFEEDVNGPEDH